MACSSACACVFVTKWIFNKLFSLYFHIVLEKKMLQTKFRRKDDMRALCLTVNWKWTEKSWGWERERTSEKSRSHERNSKLVTSILLRTVYSCIVNSECGKVGRSKLWRDHRRSRREQRIYRSPFVFMWIWNELFSTLRIRTYLLIVKCLSGIKIKYM